MYKIMIVEDDPVIAGAMEKHIASWGHGVYTARSFQNILSEYEAAQPHLVLMDIALPFYDGYYWCREIRKRSQVPVIFISSAGEDMNIIMAMNMGETILLRSPLI